jgi:hypothetical protein
MYEFVKSEKGWYVRWGFPVEEPIADTGLKCKQIEQESLVHPCQVVQQEEEYRQNTAA